MRHADEFHLKRADVHHVTRLDAMQQHVAKQIVFFEFAFSEAGGEVGTVDGDVESLKNIRQSPKMIFVTVRQNYGRDVVAILVEEAEVRDGDVDAVSRLFRKAHAGVENQH